MCWALIEEISRRAEEMAGEKEMACCVRGYHVYKDIEAAATGKVLVCRRWRAVVGKIFVVKLLIHSCKIFSYVFCVQKYFSNEKKANYGITHTKPPSNQMALTIHFPIHPSIG